MLAKSCKYSSLLNSGWESHLSKTQFFDLLNGNSHCEMVVMIT